MDKTRGLVVEGRLSETWDVLVSVGSFWRFFFLSLEVPLMVYV